MKLRKPLTAIAAMALTLGLVAGCARSGDPGDSPTGGGDTTTAPAPTGIEGMFGPQDEGGTPVEGGTLRFAMFSEPRALDPTITIAAGSTGGIEMVSVFDSLMRYDAENAEFVPQLAESLEPNDDYTEWTLKLREGVEFTNGDPLDAAAVKFSQDRYGAAPAAPDGPLWVRNVGSVEVVDDLTVKYTMNRPFVLFPSTLVTGAGMIVAEAGIDGEDFTPIGAGPFTLANWEPRTSMTLERNPNYWDGEAPLESIQFVYYHNPQVSVDALASQDVDAIMIRDSDQVEPLKAEGKSGYMNVTTAGALGLVNAQEGRPGNDVRVRKAIQLASDAQALETQVFGEHGWGSPTIFFEDSRWATETQGLAHDVEEAQKLLEEAKADGYDGKLEMLIGPGPALQNRALAFKAQMEVVGFEVEIDQVQAIADQITRIAATQDYDITAWAHNFREGDPLAKMYSTLHSQGNQTYGGYTSPEFDQILEDFEAATTFEEQQAVLERLQEQMNEDVPFVVWSGKHEVNIWNDNVHGVIGSGNTMVILGKAWVD